MEDFDQHYQNLLLIFRRYLSGDIELIKAIKSFGQTFFVSAKGWQFTLPDLYGFYCLQNKMLNFPEYKQFRKFLYDNPTNQFISEFNGRFEVVEDHGHVDKNVYQLFRQ